MAPSRENIVNNEQNTSAQVSRLYGVNLCQRVPRSWLQFSVGYILVHIMHFFFKTSDSFSTVWTHTNSELLTSSGREKMKLLPEFAGDYWLYMVKITTDISPVCRWVIKVRDSGRNLDLNDQPLSGKLLCATHVLNRQKFEEFIQEYQRKLFQDLRENTKETERTNRSRSSGKNKPMLLQNDIARAHTNVATSAAVGHIEFEVVPYPLYSPDLAPSEILLFLAQRNVSNELIPLVMKKWFREQPEIFYKDGFEKLVQPQRRCIEVEEHCLEKWGIETKHNTHSELCFPLWFLSISCWDKITWIQRHYIPNALRRLMYVGNDKQRDGALARLPDARSYGGAIYSRVLSTVSWNRFKALRKRQR